MHTPLQLTPSGAFDPASGVSYQLNPSGRCILTCLGEGSNRADIVSQLREHYPQVPEARLRRDLERFLSELRRHGALRETAA